MIFHKKSKIFQDFLKLDLFDHGVGGAGPVSLRGNKLCPTAPVARPGICRFQLSKIKKKRSPKPVSPTKTDKGKWVSDDTRKIRRFSRRTSPPGYWPVTPPGSSDWLQIDMYGTSVNTWEGALCPARITLALAQRPTHITTYEEDEEGPGKLDLKTSGPE